jgi:RNA recognition motif-containing protein
MGNKLYVGNLAYSIRDEDLQQAFAQFGTVSSAKVMMDRDTGRSKGFGFVEMGSDAEAQSAINGMNGQNLEGRALVVNEARPREERPGGFRSGGGGGGGGGGYGGGGGGGGYGGGGGGQSGPADDPWATGPSGGGGGAGAGAGAGGFGGSQEEPPF